MSSHSDTARLESILAYIADIDTIIQRHQSIENALLDIEGQYALMMCLQQIGELVNKIESEEYTSRIPVADIVGFRNIIAHNYDGMNLHIAAAVLEKNIPELRCIINDMLGS